MSKRIEPDALRSSGSCSRAARSAKKRSVGSVVVMPSQTLVLLGLVLDAVMVIPASRVATNGYTSTEIIPAPMSDAPTLSEMSPRS